MRTIFPTSAFLAGALFFFSWQELAQAQTIEKVPSAQEKNRLFFSQKPPPHKEQLS
jgi:hypothetical protein